MRAYFVGWVVGLAVMTIAAALLGAWYGERKTLEETEIVHVVALAMVFTIVTVTTVARRTRRGLGVAKPLAAITALVYSFAGLFAAAWVATPPGPFNPAAFATQDTLIFCAGLLLIAGGPSAWLVGRLTRGLEPGPPPPSSGGTAAWAGPDTVLSHEKLNYDARGLLLGLRAMFAGEEPAPYNVQQAGDRVLWLDGEGHLLTIGGTGSGKGTTSIIPNLLFWPGSTIVIDPKGENAAITSRRRHELGQAVHILDPWEIVKNPDPSVQAFIDSHRVGFNPLAGLASADDETKADVAGVVANSLVFRSGDSKQGHWDDTGESMIRTLILHCITQETSENHSLAMVRHYLGQRPEDWALFLEEMMRNQSCGGMVSRGAAQILGRGESEEARGVLSTVNKNLEFLDHPRMQRVLDGSAFELTQLKTKPTTVYLCLPNQQIGPMARWLRLFVNVAGARLMEGAPNVPVLFLLDEFPALGKLQMIERAYGEARGFGVKVWPLVQDLAQLEDIYGKRWHSFLGNAEAIQILGINDQFTAEEISKLLGDTTVYTTSTSTGFNPGGESSGTSISEKDRRLMTPEEVRRWTSQAENSIALVRGAHPIKLHKLPYFKPGVGFDGLYDPL